MRWKKNSMGDTYEVDKNTYNKKEATKRFVEEQGYLNAEQISEITGIRRSNVDDRLRKYKKLSTLNFVEVDRYDLQNNCKPEYSRTSSIQDLKLREKDQKVLQCLYSEKVSNTRITNFKNDNLDSEKVRIMDYSHSNTPNLDSQNNGTKVSLTRKTRYNTLETKEIGTKHGNMSRYNTKVAFDKAVIHNVTYVPENNKNKVTYYSSNILDWFTLDVPKAAPLEDRFKLFSAILLKDSQKTEFVKSLQQELVKKDDEKYLVFNKGLNKGTQSMQVQLDEEKRIKSKHFQRTKKLSAENKELKNSNEELQRKFDILKGLFKEMYTDLDRFVEKRDNVYKENFVGAVEKAIEEKLEKKDELFK